MPAEHESRPFTHEEKMNALVDEGVCDTLAEAIHMLVDMGEISTSTHCFMLKTYAPDEYKRVYS